MRLSILVASMWLWSTVFAAAMNQPRSNSKSGDGSKLTSKELECSHRFHDSQEIKGSHWRKLCCKQSEVSEKEQQREALDEHVRALSQGYDGLQHPNPLLSMIFPGPCVSWWRDENLWFERRDDWSERARNIHSFCSDPNHVLCCNKFVTEGPEPWGKAENCVSALAMQKKPEKGQKEKKEEKQGDTSVPVAQPVRVKVPAARSHKTRVQSGKVGTVRDRPSPAWTVPGWAKPLEFWKRPSEATSS